ncbi:hypothetical protein [Allohahella sp. A8]
MSDSQLEQKQIETLWTRLRKMIQMNAELQNENRVLKQQLNQIKKAVAA